MSYYYFDTPERQGALEEILESWLGTPFKHHTGVKGLGVDCIHFVGKVLEELGILTWRKGLIPDYPRDWHLHNSEELLSHAIEKSLKVEKVEVGNNIAGDIILYHFGQAASHAAIFCDGWVYHAVEGSGVIRTDFLDAIFHKRAAFTYRVLA